MALRILGLLIGFAIVLSFSWILIKFDYWLEEQERNKEK